MGYLYFIYLLVILWLVATSPKLAGLRRRRRERRSWMKGRTRFTAGRS